MKRFLRTVLCFAVVLGTVAFVMTRQMPSVTVRDEFEAARLLKAQLTADLDDNEIVFQHSSLDQRGVFQALEATWPYAFSLHSTTHANKTAQVRIIVEQPAAQKQAFLLAQGIVPNLFAQTIPLKDKLRALHDYVVTHCIYDEGTARNTLEDLTSGSGGDAPFTAAGMLVDGKAVCAGYARAFMMLCAAANIDAVYIADAGMNHGWNAVRVYDQIYYIDTTFDDPVPDRGELVSTKYFMGTREEFEISHTWDFAFYDRLIANALPPTLGDAQKLFDLGMLQQLPTAQSIAQPLSAGQRDSLVALTGQTLPQSATLGEACATIWQALYETPLARTLYQQGQFDAYRAGLVGIPADAIK